MSNLGDEASTATFALAQKAMDILFLLLKWIYEHTRGHLELPVKFGEISRRNLNKMARAGDRPRTMQIPADKLHELNRIAKQLGAQYFVMEKSGNTAVVAVPESSYSQLNDAVVLLTQKMFSENKESVNIHGNNEIIPPEKKTAVNETLDYYDIPVYKIERPDGSQVNIVPAEFEEKYRAAMEIAEKTAERMKNDVVIEKYKPTVPLNEINYTVRKTEPLEAANLAAAFGKDIEIITDGKEYAVKYDDSLEEKINTAFGNVENEIKGIRTAVVDNSISIDSGNIEGETDKAYFVRIPNTKGTAYMQIEKELVDAAKSTDKTKYSFIDINRNYPIFDKDGNFTRYVSGENLVQKWNTRSVLGNRESEITHHGRDNLERIEIYDPVKNRLFSIELNAETAKQTLMQNGFSALSADRILSDVSKKMNDEQRKRFGFENFSISEKARKIDNIEDIIRESEIAHLVRDAEFKGEALPFSKEESICVYEKTTKKYTLVDAGSSPDALRDTLRELGCTDIEQNIAAAQIAEGIRLKETKEKMSPQYFDSDMAEIKGMCFEYSKELNSAVILRPTEDGGVKYAALSSGSTRESLEKVLTDKNNFGLSDLAAAEIIQCCMKNDMSKIVDPAKVHRIKDTSVSVSQITSKYISVSDGTKSILCEPSKINAAQLQKDFGITKEKAEKVAAAVRKTFDSDERKDGRIPLKQRIKAITQRSRVKEESREKTVTRTDEKGKASETVDLNKSSRVI